MAVQQSLARRDVAQSAGHLDIFGVNDDNVSPRQIKRFVQGFPHGRRVFNAEEVVCVHQDFQARGLQFRLISAKLNLLALKLEFHRIRTACDGLKRSE